MLTKFLLLSCAYAIVSSFGDGHYYAMKPSMENFQHFSSEKIHQPTPIQLKQHIAPAQYSSVEYVQPQQPPKQQDVAPAVPSPFSFSYEADGSARQESSDRSGRVTGSYTVINEDGSKRVVKYIADEQGFRAQIDTDEPGTRSDSPANIKLKSAAVVSNQPATYTPETVSTFSDASAEQTKHQSQVPQKSVQSSPAPSTSSDHGSAAYAFDYKSQSAEGNSTRNESADASGKVIGSYSLTNTDGSQRTVEYIADEGGFRAKVQTSESGTKSDSPADVAFRSTAPQSAPSAPEQYSMGQYLALRSKAPSQSSIVYTGVEVDGQQQVHSQAPTSFKTPPASFAAEPKPFQGKQQQIKQSAQFVPAPYAFNYNAEGSARQESSDKSGKVTGSYSVTNEDGSIRIVEYIADENGFRAKVKTDEPGTKSENPANVVLQSSAPKPKPYSAPQQPQYQ